MDGIESSRPGISSRVPRLSHAIVAVLSLLPTLALAARAEARAGTPSGARSSTIRFAGVRVHVPAGWPVVDLRRDPTACVRFDRHAVYLGRPGAHAACPGHRAGRTEAILVEPATTAGPGLGRGAPAALVRRTRAAEVFATWRTGAATIRRALDVSRLPARAAPHPAVGRRAARAAADRAAADRDRTAADRATDTPAGGAVSPTPGTGPTSPSAAPGQVYTGPGFDACSAPSRAQMDAWASSPYRALGVYIGGANMACAQTNLTASWLSAEAEAGWHAIPTYVGLQAPGNSCGCAAIQPASASSEGTAAAQDAIAQAEALGLGPGNPVYFDMEAYPHNRQNTTPVLAFLAAWTQTLHGSGYLSGVYSSENSGIYDLVAQYGSSYPEPDELWVANWNNQRSTADAAVPSADWSSHQRIHQYQGDHTETYGGTKLDIDGDYVDSATAASGSGTASAAASGVPVLRVTPAADGSIALTPSWSNGPPVASWQFLAGATPGTVATLGNPVSAAGTAVTVIHSAYAYFSVQARDSTNAVIGTANVVATPPHLTLAGASAFVPASGVGGVPITCINTTTCHVSARVVSGRTTLALSPALTFAPGAAVLHFALTPAARRALLHSRHQTVLVRLRDASGLSATKAMTLQEFRTSGPSPQRSATPAASVAITGMTDYVSNGWVGGMLTACRASVPCLITTTVTVGGTTVAQTGAEYLGAGELGYLLFTLTPHGHALLAAARGNQLAARVTAVNGTDTATAGVALVAFP